ncbi:MAG: ABC transporter permease [Verrucomicrobiales bacterium]|nr:ABC transporter permease [Verrucomicrobiales bacterium]
MQWLTDNLERAGERVRELAADRARSLLVVLGVVWGTLSLTVVFAFGNGLQQAIGNALEASGRDYVRVWSGTTTRAHAGLSPGRWIGLQPKDADLIGQGVPGVRGISVEFIAGNQSITRAQDHINAGIHGVEPGYGELRSIRPAPGGRFLNPQDEAERRRVVFLGDVIKQRLFGDRPAVGASVELWGRPFTVIGVMRPKVAMSNYEWKDEEKLFIPATTFSDLTGRQYVSYLIVGLDGPQLDEAVIGRLRTVLARQHGFDARDLPAVGLQNQVATDRMTRGIVTGVRTLLAIVGTLGLLVALVGVTNVLFVMVEEQRHEIGLWMALGATPRTVLFGPLLDGALVTLGGGILGIVGSLAVLHAFNALPLGREPRAYLGSPEVSPGIALGVTAVLCVAAVGAAWFPARQAALADPVESLREE